MATAALPWTCPQPLAAAPRRLSGVEGVRSVIAFGSRGRGHGQADSDLALAVICAEARLNPDLKRQRWRQCRRALGLLDRGVDLVALARDRRWAAAPPWGPWASSLRCRASSRAGREARGSSRRSGSAAAADRPPQRIGRRSGSAGPGRTSA